jgi:hypothetical protein
LLQRFHCPLVFGEHVAAAVTLSAFFRKMLDMADK